MKATEHRSQSLNASGFTLLEVMIALAIIGMTVTVILHTVNYHADIMYENTLSTHMFQMAKEKMVELEMDNTASTGVISNTDITYEKTISETDDPEIIELRATITGQGKKITLSQLTRKKRNFNEIHFMITERQDKGFTLMEVLISITLLTVVLGAVYSTFFSVHRAIERFETISVKYHEARTSLDIMRREIEGAVLKNPRAEDGARNKTSFNIRDRDIFGRKASALDLTAFSFRGGKVDTISYFVSENEGKLELVKSVTPSIIGRGDYKIGMIEGIEGFNVEILFNNKWVGTWASSDTGKLPDIVRLSIEFDDNGKKVMLTEYARPRVGKGL